MDDMLQRAKAALQAQAWAEAADTFVQLAIAFERAGNVPERDNCLREWLAIRIRHGPQAGTAVTPARPIPDTTLVCVDCRYYDLAADALARTLGRCTFDRAILFTDTDVRVEGVETICIEPISSLGGYSRFLIKDLAPYIDTEFALVMQYDGYVLSGESWSNDFQRYDYVGAPWDRDDGMAVGNGGFSLRSRRLLRALQDPDILPLDPEDLAICRTYRPLLEARHGIRFAPPEVAARFSFESLPRQGPTFGFHGVDHLYYLIDMTDAEIDAYRPSK